jgi:hypothetical protein
MAVSLLMICLTGCAAKPDPLQATVNGIAAQQAFSFPDYPSDCRITLASGAVRGEPIEKTLLRMDGRLDQQNKRVTRCAAWYDTNTASWGVE